MTRSLFCLGAIACLLAGCDAASTGPASSNSNTASLPVIQLTEANFASEVLASDRPVLVDFWATWCGPCRSMTPVIEQLASDFEGQAKVCQLNVDDNAALARKYQVRSIPRFLVFQNGEVVQSTLGVVPKSKLADQLAALLPVTEQ